MFAGPRRSFDSDDDYEYSSDDSHVDDKHKDDDDEYDDDDDDPAWKPSKVFRICSWLVVSVASVFGY